MNILKKIVLFSTSFEETLKWMVINNNNPVAKYLIDVNKKVKSISKALDLREIKKIREDIFSNITDYCSYITLRSDVFELSFLPKGCKAEYVESGRWSKKNRQSGKPGKIIQKLIGSGKFSNADYEQFVYQLKARWMYKGYELKLVKGEDIRFWYNCENYYSVNNTLGNSCMKGDECSSYFDIYCEQPECQMLVALKEGLLAARALVWTIDGETFMDRVYYIEDALYTVFINYAKEQKWYIRENNELLHDGDNQIFKSPLDNYSEPLWKKFELNLLRLYDNWPYIDTFRYLDVHNLTLSTSIDDNTYCCSFIDGTYEEETFTCEYCDTNVSDEDCLVYSEYYEMNGCINCMTYSNILNDWILKTYAIEVSLGTFSSLVPQDYLESHPEDFKLVGEHWIYKEHPYFNL